MCNLHGTYTANGSALWDLHILHGVFRVHTLRVFQGNTGNTTTASLCYVPLWRNRKGNSEATFKATQFTLLHCLFPMLPVFPLLYGRVAVAYFSDKACFGLVTSSRSKRKDTFDSRAIISLCSLRGSEAMLPQIISEKAFSIFTACFSHIFISS